MAATTFNNQIVYDIFQKLYPKPRDFITPKRFFVREGDLLVFHSKKRKKVIRHFYLFNDRLLVTKRSNSTLTKHSDWLKVDVSLRARDVDIENMKTASNNNEFRLHLPGRVSYLIYGRTAEEKDLWCDDILKAIKGEHPGDVGYKKKKKKEELRRKSAMPAVKEEKEIHRDEEIMINESEDSSDEKTPLKNPSSKIRERAKVQSYHRTQSEVVTQTTRKKAIGRKSVQPAAPTPVFTGNMVDINPFVAQGPGGQPLKENSSPTSNSSDNVTPKRRLNRKNKGSAPHKEIHRDTPSRAQSHPINNEIFQVPNTLTPITAPAAPSAFTLNPFPQSYPIVGAYHPSGMGGIANPFAFTAVVPPQQSTQQPPASIIPPSLNNNVNPFLSFQNQGSSVPNNLNGFPATTVPPQGLFFNVN